MIEINSAAVTSSMSTITNDYKFNSSVSSSVSSHGFKSAKSKNGKQGSGGTSIVSAKVNDYRKVKFSLFKFSVF